MDARQNPRPLSAPRGGRGAVAPPCPGVPADRAARRASSSPPGHHCQPEMPPDPGNVAFPPRLRQRQSPLLFHCRFTSLRLWAGSRSARSARPTPSACSGGAGRGRSPQPWAPAPGGIQKAPSWTAGGLLGNIASRRGGRPPLSVSPIEIDDSRQAGRLSSS